MELERRGIRKAENERFMKEALLEAKKAEDLREVPIGCVIAQDGEIIGRGHNRRTTDKNVLAHAEIMAINEACGALHDWRLEDCVLYVTLEPCPMCAGAMVQSRLGRCVIGSMSDKSGCAGSVINLLQQEGFNHRVEIESGVLKEECAELLSGFFERMRKAGR
ncbi:MAG: tRNA adenosine(34) deaminase TadA [Lachnospiraceae bacterium]|nr:tRNA adenosine(34) deaminase TadA [Lachnospiraceae bacterium]MBQ6874905.1 tRNA adenosine(34) deaminase TadA [Lachnospiraceae bacterium]